MKKLFKILSIILITIISALLVFSLMSFKNAGGSQNLNSSRQVTDLEDISIPKPDKPSVTTTTTATSTTKGSTASAEYIFIDAKGTGDYKTLEDAVSNASEGATIILDSGTYALEDGLDISKSINLIGKGPDKTIITGEKGLFVIHFSAKGKFFTEGIAFLRKGQEPGNIFEVNSGEASFNNCLLSGGKPKQDEENWGIGIIYYENATGTVSNCVIESNSFCGICVEDDAKVTLINNISRKNTYSGISYFGSNGGYAIKNECYSNGSDGIQVQLNSIPTLIKNKCHDNKYCGISYYDTSGGLAFQNECTKNQWGIYVSSTATPTLEANITKNNTKKDLLKE